MSRLLERLRLALENSDALNYKISTEVASNMRHRAAVLILLLPHTKSTMTSNWFSGCNKDEEEEGDEYDVLLTRRSTNLRVFPGSTAFPGGKMDASDISVIHTALREANEEVGILPEEVNVLGILPPMLVRHGHLTYGVVGFLNEKKDKWTRPVNEMEIDDVFRVPLRRFLSTRALFPVPPMFTDQPWVVAGFVDSVGGDEETKIRETWGFTAIFCMITARLAYGSNPDYPNFYIFPGFMERPLKDILYDVNEFTSSLIVHSKL